MSKKLIIGIIAALAVVAAVLGIMNRSSGPKKDGLMIVFGGKETVISWEEIGRTSFEGDLINGKGETKHNTYEGTELKNLLGKAGAEIAENNKITVTSEDNYSAELTGSELLEEGKVYVALARDGEMIEGIEGGQGAQLIVFGDPNQKRAVRYMKTVAIE